MSKLKHMLLGILMVIVVGTVCVLTDYFVKMHNVESMIERVMPSVVHIQYEEDEYGGRTWQGSGVIISEDGLILTARHVAQYPGKFTVTLSDGRKFVTKKACVSREYDVGYLKVNEANLPAAEFGDSDTLKLGCRLFAIGSPWGQGHFNSVTLGILSAYHRDYSKEIGAPSGWGMLFQTDVAANPGNSGGPVLNTKGEVVGIVVGLYGPGSYAGITYCVPSNVCKSIIKSVRMVFALQEVEIVEANERLNNLEDAVRNLEYDLYDTERRLEELIRNLFLSPYESNDISLEELRNNFMKLE